MKLIESVVHNINEHGAKHTIDTLIKEKKWDRLLLSLETGGELNMVTAKKLLEEADASTAEGLRFAITKSMRADPISALKLIDENYTIDDICSFPYIENKKANQEFFDSVVKNLKELKVETMEPPISTNLIDKCLKKLNTLERFLTDQS